jgi:hypothetical protein
MTRSSNINADWKVSKKCPASGTQRSGRFNTALCVQVSLIWTKFTTGRATTRASELAASAARVYVTDFTLPNSASLLTSSFGSCHFLFYFCPFLDFGSECSGFKKSGDILD